MHAYAERERRREQVAHSKKNMRRTEGVERRCGAKTRLDIPCEAGDEHATAVGRVACACHGGERCLRARVWGERVGRARARLSLSQPPKGVPKTPPSATTSPKLSEAASCASMGEAAVEREKKGGRPVGVECASKQRRAAL
eukprot:6196414-Pleurochrysis_carterae.AAC.5